MPHPRLRHAAARTGSVLALAGAVTGLVLAARAMPAGHHGQAADSTGATSAATAVAAPDPGLPSDRSAAASRGATRTPPLRVRRPDILVLLPHAARADAVHRLDRRPGVSAVALLDRGAVRVGRHRLTVLGGDPRSVRPLTPSLTATSEPLWQSVARGELTMSYTRAHSWRRRLGGTLTARARHGFFPVRLGAFASLGLGRADALVDAAQARALGLRPARELLVSARRVPLAQLRTDVRRLFGPGARIHSLRPRHVDQASLLSAYARATIPASYLSLYRAAATTCTGLPWTVLAAIGAVETGHGANTHVSSKGAVGPMQFLPSTFAAYAVDGDHDGVADIRDPADAVYTAARYLCFAGAGRGGQSLYDAVWAYNHADWYVRAVLDLAVAYS